MSRGEDTPDAEVEKQLPRRFDSVAPTGKTNIHHSNLRPMLSRKLNRFFGGRGDSDDMKSRVGQGALGLHGDQKIVLNNEDSVRFAGILAQIHPIGSSTPLIGPIRRCAEAIVRRRPGPVYHGIDCEEKRTVARQGVLVTSKLA
jgi:hypothetical protein